MEDLQAAEDKVDHLNKIKSKLEQTLDELEDSLAREKRQRADIEKQRRKTEGDLKVTQETVAEIDHKFYIYITLINYLVHSFFPSAMTKILKEQPII